MEVRIADGFFDSLDRVFRPWWHPKELWYQFKCWAWYRYSTVKPRYLGHTWCDRSYLLPHVMFEILSKFIEEECSPGHVAWYGECGHKVEVHGKQKYVRDELQDLYDWWHKEYHGRYKKLVDLGYEVSMAHDEAHQTQLFEEDARGCLFNPQYNSEEAKKRAKELTWRNNAIEQAIENALDDRMTRLLAVRRYMWT